MKRILIHTPSFFVLTNITNANYNKFDSIRFGSFSRNIHIDTIPTSITIPSENMMGEIAYANSGYGYSNVFLNQKIKISTPDDKVVKAVNKILSYSGLSIDFQIYSANIKDVTALTVLGERIILYDPTIIDLSFSNNKTYWSSISMLSNAIAHHILNHSLGSFEAFQQDVLKADKFTGFVLFYMGASENLSKAVLANVEKQPYPNKKSRSEAIMKGWQEALRARYHPMIPPETAASLANRFPNHVAFTPKMFIDEKWRSSSYDFALKYPIVYEAVILEVDSNWEGGPGGPGEYEMAMLVLIKNTFRSQRAKDNNLTASLKKGEKVWITYVEFPNHTLFTDDFFAYPHHKWFDRIMQPGTAIHFSAFREGGNSLGTRKLIYLKKINREYK